MTKPNLDEKRDALLFAFEAKLRSVGRNGYNPQEFEAFIWGTENAALEALREVNEAKDARIAELTEAIVFSLRGLQMWRTYQSPGNIAEVEQRLRQALKRDGGSDE